MPPESTFWRAVHADARRGHEVAAERDRVMDGLWAKLGLSPSRTPAPTFTQQLN